VVWDGTYRILYVDGGEVACDTLSALDTPLARLVLGGGANLAPTTFWTGLIDDVRIYNRAVTP
jgi:riboflavin biosynthesis pyrimidine reductase